VGLFTYRARFGGLFLWADEMSGDLKAQIEISADASGVEAGVGRAKKSLNDLGASAAASGKSAAAGFSKIGENAAGSAAKVDAATRNQINSIQRLVASLEAGSKTSREYQEALARIRGADLNQLRPYLDRLDQVNAKHKAVEQSADGLGRAFGSISDYAKVAAASIATLVSVGTIISQINAAIDTLARLDDVAQKTGSSVENLSRLQKVAAAFDTDFGSVDSAISKLAKGMATVDDESNKVNRALSAIGVSARDAAGKLRDPSEVMVDIARNLQNYEDGASKAALATDLFGKAGADLLPYLNDLAENVDKFGGASSDAAKRASEFKDQLGIMRVQSQELYTSIAEALVPAMNALLKAINDNNAASEGMAKGSGLKEWADDVASSIATVIDKALYAKRVIAALRAEGRNWLENSKGVAIALLPGLTPNEDTTFSERWGRFIDNMRNGKVRKETDAAWAALGKSNTKAYEDAVNANLGRVVFNDRRFSGEVAATPPQKKTLGYTSGNKKDVSDAISDYEKLIRTISEKIAVENAALSSSEKLTEAEKMRAKLYADLASGAISLTSKEKDLALARLGTLETLERSKAAKVEIERLYSSIASESKKAVESAQREADSNERLAETYGMTRGEIAAVELARLEEQYAQRSSLGLTLDEIESLEKLIDAKRRSAAALSKVDALDAAKKLSDQWKRDFDRIEDWIGDAIGRGVTKGKDIFKSLIDGLKASFARLVFSPIIQPIAAFGASILNPAAVPATGGVSGLMQTSNLFSMGRTLWDGFSTGFSGVGNTVTAAVQRAMDAVGWTGNATRFSDAAFEAGLPSAAETGATPFASAAGQVASIVASMLASRGISSLISNGYKINHGQALNNIGMLFGPIGGLVTGTINRAFGTKLAGSGVLGSITGDQFSGQSYEFRKGGFLRGDKTVTSALDTAVDQTFSSAVKSMYDNFSSLGDTIGAGGDLLKGFSYEFRLALRDFDDAGKQEEIQRALSSMSDSMAREFVDAFRTSIDTAEQAANRYFTNTIDGERNFGTGETVSKSRVASAIEPFIDDIVRIFDARRAALAGVEGVEGQLAAFTSQLFSLGGEFVKNAGFAKVFGEAIDFKKLEGAASKGETVIDTFARLSTVFAATNSVAQLLGKNAETAFGVAGLASAAARQRIIDLAGGIDKLAAGTDFFSQNFLSEEERLAPVIKQVDEVLATVGWSGIRTKEQFAALVKSLDLSSEAGAKAYAQLMGIQEAFLLVANSTESSAEKVKQAAMDKRQAALDSVQNQYGSLQRSIDAQRKAITENYEGILGDLNERLKIVNQSVSRLSSLSSTLRSAVNAMRAPSDVSTAREMALAQIEAAKAIARAGGVFPDSESIQAAISALGEPTQEMFVSFSDYQRELQRQRNSITELADLTDSQLSIEEETLRELENQTNLAEQRYNDEMGRLDGILESAQTQIDALNGVNLGVLSVRDAIESLNRVLVAAGGRPVAVPNQGAGSGASAVAPSADQQFVESLYSQYLGRASDAAGLAHWTNLLGSGALTPSDVIQGFINSDEFKKIHGYATGGYHPGGWRLVGEKGPELAYTGPETIFSNAVSTALLRSLTNPGRDDSALVAEIRALRAENAELRKCIEDGLYSVALHTSSTAEAIDAATFGGRPIKVEIA